MGDIDFRREMQKFTNDFQIILACKGLNFHAIAEILEMKGYDDPDGTLQKLQRLGDLMREKRALANQKETA